MSGINLKQLTKRIIPTALWNALSYHYHKRIFYLVFFDVKFIVKRTLNKLRHRGVLFYPDKPHESYVVNKICSLLGYKIVNNLNKYYNLAINWEATTRRLYSSNLFHLSKRMKIANLQCNDISKKKVDAIFKEVFGYSLAIDPCRVFGNCVKKSDLNGRHDGKIIKCPIEKIDDGFVYQRVINNSTENNSVEDIRVPILKESVPFVYLKYRPSYDRFSNKNSSVKISELDNVISKEEKEKISLFCKKIGLDYGELDMARDMRDKKLYIFDVNNTPFGPPNHISAYGYITALKKMAVNFEKAFM